MKKYAVLLGIIAALSLAAILCTNLNSDTSGHTGSASHTQFKVVYVKDGQAILTEIVEKGGIASPPYEEDIPDGKFITWCVNGAEYDFSTPVTGETVLTAVYNRRYTVTFAADGEAVASSEYTYFNRTVTAPPAPEKYGYVGVWESCTLDGGDKIVNAVYTPVGYVITFMCEGTDAQEVTCSIEDYKDKIPEVPPKRGFEGVWEYERVKDNIISAVARYTPVKYRVNFYVDGEIVHTGTYTAEECDMYLPEIPHREHYTAKWEDFALDSPTVSVNAIYTPVIYKAAFIADGETVEIVDYTILDKALDEPAVPEKAHYSAKWESYGLPYADFRICAEYSPTEYTVSFLADGVKVAEKPYTVETDISSFELPSVPKKAGYTGEWDTFSFSGGNLEVSAIYTPAEITEGLEFERTQDGYSVTAYKGDSKEVTVPSYYDGLPVTEIGPNAFINCRIEKVTICENVKVLRRETFSRCESLKTVELPQSLEVIGDYAFYICLSLTQFTVPDGVKEIGEFAFAGCSSLESVYIGENVQSIGQNAFLRCDKLQSAYFAISAGWTAFPSSDYGAQIDISPQSAAKILTQSYGYSFVKIQKENV